jgi:hypothetical protein
VFIAGNEQEGPHMFTPNPPNPDAPIPAEIQDAFFNASNLGALLAIIPEEGETNPSTYQIAEVVAAHIYSNLDPNFDGDFSDAQAPTSEQIADVATHLFSSSQHLSLQQAPDEGGDDRVADNGDMFPHTPLGALFSYEIAFTEDGDVEVSDVCKIVPLDVRPWSTKNRIWLKSKGNLWIAMLSTDDFDAADVDDDTVECGGVAPKKCKLLDVNKDGVKDLLCRWKIQDLVKAGVLHKDSESLSVMAMLDDGSCVEGEDFVDIVKFWWEDDDEDEDD